MNCRYSTFKNPFLGRNMAHAMTREHRVRKRMMKDEDGRMASFMTPWEFGLFIPNDHLRTHFNTLSTYFTQMTLLVMHWLIYMSTC